jgi:hypothetical protein
MFPGNVDFEEDRDPPGRLLGSRVNFLSETKAVDALNRFKQLHGVPRFVGLEMANHVPAYPARAERNFCFGFLNLAFPEIIKPKFYRFIDHLRRLAFRHGEQQHLLRRTARAGASRFNTLLNRAQVFCQAHGKTLKVFLPGE